MDQSGLLPHVGLLAKYGDADFLLVAEAGSRAWGFASVDSDWDIRFVFAYREQRKYVQIGDPPDVLQFSDGGLDFHGWDIKKALRLAAKSNFSLYEWLCSPIIYLESSHAQALRSYVENC